MRVDIFSSGEQGWTGNLAYPNFGLMGHLMSQCEPTGTDKSSFIFIIDSVLPNQISYCNWALPYFCCARTPLAQKIKI